MADESIIETAESATEEDNKRIASALSLQHNEPDAKGRTRIEQAKDELDKLSLDSRRAANFPFVVGDSAWIPADVPVGLGPKLDSFITRTPLKVTLTDSFGGYGGMGYGQDSNKLVDLLPKVSVQLPHEEGQPPKTVTLQVPYNLLTRSDPEGSGSSSNAPAA